MYAVYRETTTGLQCCRWVKYKLVESSRLTVHYICSPLKENDLIELLLLLPPHHTIIATSYPIQPGSDASQWHLRTDKWWLEWLKALQVHWPGWWVWCRCLNMWMTDSCGSVDEVRWLHARWIAKLDWRYHCDWLLRSWWLLWCDVMLLLAFTLLNYLRYIYDDGVKSSRTRFSFSLLCSIRHCILIMGWEHYDTLAKGSTRHIPRNTLQATTAPSLCPRLQPQDGCSR